MRARLLRKNYLKLFGITLIHSLENNSLEI